MTDPGAYHLEAWHPTSNPSVTPKGNRGAFLFLCQVTIGVPPVPLKPPRWPGGIVAALQLESAAGIDSLVVEQEGILVAPVQALVLPIVHVGVIKKLTPDVPGAVGDNTFPFRVVVVKAPS